MLKKREATSPFYNSHDQKPRADIESCSYFYLCSGTIGPEWRGSEEFCEGVVMVPGETTAEGAVQQIKRDRT